MIARVAARVRSLWWNLRHRDRVEAALDDEVHTYVDLLTAEYERAGMTPAVARRTALVHTGGIHQVKAATRDAWAGDSVTTVVRELRYTVRSLRRSPAFLGVAVGTLAIGIGGATAVFTVINGSLLRPLPGAAEPERLVTIERVMRTQVVAEFSYPDFRDLREQSTTLTGLAAFNGTSMAIEDPAGAGRAWVGDVSDNFFDVLGVRPLHGRLLRASDAAGQGGETEPVVVLGHAIWQRRFGGSAAVIGSTVTLNDRPYTIVGVTPPGFIGAMTAHPMELWMPITMSGAPAPAVADIDFESRRDAWLRLVGRLARGRSDDDAQVDLTGIAARSATTDSPSDDRAVQVSPGAGLTAEERTEVSRVPRLLAGAVMLLLTIACGNVAGLALVRAAARRRELATRLALGASRVVLVRQVVLEGAAIAAAAGLLGVIVAHLLVQSAGVVRTVVSLPDVDLSMDLRVLGVAVAASVLTAVLVSLLPAIQLFRVPPGAVLKDGGGGALRRRTGQRALVAAQVGASVVLLAGAAIVHGAFQRVLTAHDGSQPRGITDATLEVRESLPDIQARLAFYRALLARANAEPGIAAASIASTIPPFQWSGRAAIYRRGEEPPAGTLPARDAQGGLRVQTITVSEEFFDVMRIPVLLGRAFEARDDERAAPVAIVSRRVADELWPGKDPLDQSLMWPAADGTTRPPLRVVGVVADTRDLSPGAPSPLAMYVPYPQRPNPHLLVVRARGDVPVTADILRRIVADVDPRVTVLGGRTLFDRLRDEARPQQIASAWIGVFSAIALMLASIGLYGVVAQGVLQRTRELAVRSALGAPPGGIIAMVIGDGMRLVAVGGVVGGFGAIAAFRLLRSLFSGVEAVDAGAACAAVAMVGIATLIAAWLPARRAARLNPVDALRCE